MQCPKMQITFTSEMLKALKKEAEKSGNSVSSIVRILVAEYLEKKGTTKNVFD